VGIRHASRLIHHRSWRSLTVYVIEENEQIDPNHSPDKVFGLISCYRKPSCLVWPAAIMHQVKALKQNS
jgi:hypothetical protein